MAEEQPQLTRDSTMKVTAQEGEAFLETQGKPDESAKTRGQQKEIEKITEEEKPKIQRDSTMVETAKEGKEFLGDVVISGTRSETKAVTDAIDVTEKAEKDESAANEEEKPTVTRTGTMVATAEEGKAFLEREGFDASAEKKDDAEAEDEEAKALKRTHTMAETVKEGEEFVKRQKTSNGEVEQKEQVQES
uniref:Caldesmon-like n=1 Tax=Saccoglossus kowalevskii TaxID=10224 RepID=A0ABM0GNC1_SACKO|nr:PREDICTED: caldesmon-like [Saccoglossus kowalevskii]